MLINNKRNTGFRNFTTQLVPRTNNSPTLSRKMQSSLSATVHAKYIIGIINYVVLMSFVLISAVINYIVFN